MWVDLTNLTVKCESEVSPVRRGIKVLETVHTCTDGLRVEKRRRRRMLALPATKHSSEPQFAVAETYRYSKIDMFDHSISYDS